MGLQMQLFAKPEFVWEEPKSFVHADDKCMQMKYPRTKPHREATAIGLLFAFLVALPLWLNWVLPYPFETKTPYLIAIPAGFIFGFCFYYFILRPGISLPKDIRVFNKKIVVANEPAY